MYMGGVSCRLKIVIMLRYSSWVSSSSILFYLFIYFCVKRFWKIWHGKCPWTGCYSFHHRFCRILSLLALLVLECCRHLLLNRLRCDFFFLFTLNNRNMSYVSLLFRWYTDSIRLFFLSVTFPFFFGTLFSLLRPWSSALGEQFLMWKCLYNHWPFCLSITCFYLFLGSLTPFFSTNACMYDRLGPCFLNESSNIFFPSTLAWVKTDR